MAFPNHLRQSNVVKAINSNKESQDLQPFEVGVYDYFTNKPLTGGQTQSPRIIFALGNPNSPINVNSGKYKNFTGIHSTGMSIKSDPVFGKTIKSVRVGVPNKVKTPEIKIYGWDGFAANDKSLSFKFGKTYKMNVQVEGSGSAMILNELMKGQTYTESVVFSTPDKDDCAPSCTESTLCKDMMDEIITKFYKETNIGASGMIKVQKLISCDTPPTPLTKVTFTEFCLSLCDMGDGMSLAKVKLQYPGLDVKRVSRTGTTSTYQVCTQGTTAPADYVQTSMFIPECEDCGSSYITVTGGKLLVVRIDNTNVDNTKSLQLAEVQSKIPTATEAIKTVHENGVSTYVVVVPLTWVIPTTPIAETVIEDTGEVRKDSCVLSTPITTAWTVCGTKYKVSRNLEVTVTIPDCKGTPVAGATTKLLEELVALTSSYKDYVPGSAALVASTIGECLAKFTIKQYNNDCLEDTCDSADVPMFDSIASFKGSQWFPEVKEATSDDCKCGLKFTGAFVGYQNRSCSFDRTAFVARDSVRFTVSFEELGVPLVLNIPKPLIVPMTKVQSAKNVWLDGQAVVRDIIESRYYRLEANYSPKTYEGQLINNALGYEYGVDVDKFYYSVNVVHVPAGNGSEISVHQSMGSQREEVFYFEEADLGLMQQFLAKINSYTGSNGVNVKEAVI